MPLLDHFRPPLSVTRKWEGFHSHWTSSLAAQLNAGLLPPDVYAMIEPQAASSGLASSAPDPLEDAPGSYVLEK